MTNNTLMLQCEKCVCGALLCACWTKPETLISGMRGASLPFAAKLHQCTRMCTHFRTMASSCDISVICRQSSHCWNERTRWRALVEGRSNRLRLAALWWSCHFPISKPNQKIYCKCTNQALTIGGQQPVWRKNTGIILWRYGYWESKYLSKTSSSHQENTSPK